VWTSEKEMAGIVEKWWILHQDNAPSHSTLSVNWFLFSKNITVRAYPCYLPDLAPCDFFLFSRDKINAQRNPFFVRKKKKKKKNGNS
jgi:hypothetical protein